MSEPAPTQAVDRVRVIVRDFLLATSRSWAPEPPPSITVDVDADRQRYLIQSRTRDRTAKALLPFKHCESMTYDDLHDCLIEIGNELGAQLYTESTAP